MTDQLKESSSGAFPELAEFAKIRTRNLHPRELGFAGVSFWGLYNPFTLDREATTEEYRRKTT
ncbi:MAG TPA: hypothetical protein IGS31_00020 [Oscillatoriales cyanobacterium M4454_W2019_049]|nr:hypothetical protein [Oscillatoriales cyanobacterium M4454_W2019_049]